MHAGTVSAYGLGPRRWVALRSMLPLVSEKAPTKWVHVAHLGSWEGHESGPFEFTRETFSQIVANFDAQKNPIPLDFDHETVFSSGPTPARGWVHDLEILSDDEYGAALWALVEFGPQAVEFNRAGGYRFCSGVFEFDAVDRKTGETVGCAMSSLALTDSPFIDGQAPIQLSRRRSAHGREETMTKDTIRALMSISKESLAAALEQIEGDDITPEQLEAAAQFAAAKDGDMEEPEAPMADMPDDEEEVPTSDTPAPDAAPLADEVPLQDPDADAAMAALAPLMEATGLDLAGLAAAIMENLDAVAGALSGALEEPAAEAPLNDGGQPNPAQPGAVDKPLSDEPDETTVALSTTRAALGAVTKERDTLKAELAAIHDREADAAVETYVTAGVILDDARGDMKALYLSNRDGFNRIVAGLKPAVMPGEMTPPPLEQPDLPALSEAEEKDPDIQQLRVWLSNAGVPKPAQDKAVRERIASRKGTAI